MMFRAASTLPRRRPSLTPMIDVVFLLLVFFMLASRFGVETVLPLTMDRPGRGGTVAPDPAQPRLVDVLPDEFRVNGIVSADPAADLVPLLADPDRLVLVRARDGASLQRVLDVMAILAASGLSQTALVD